MRPCVLPKGLRIEALQALTPAYTLCLVRSGRHLLSILTLTPSPTTHCCNLSRLVSSIHLVNRSPYRPSCSPICPCPHPLSCRCTCTLTWTTTESEWALEVHRGVHMAAGVQLKCSSRWQRPQLAQSPQARQGILRAR